jgi:hypothetical protein
MTSAVAVHSKLDTHHDPGEVRNAVELDRLRLMREYSRHHSVTCDCLSDQRITEEDCAGLQVLNARGHQVASYRGRQYRALRKADGTLAIYSVLVRN